MEDTKICGGVCKLPKPFSEFSKDSSNKTGLQRKCKACQKALSAQHYRNNPGVYKDNMVFRRKKVKTHLSDLKKGPCVDCGDTFHHSLMDFDHLDAETKIASVSQIASQTMSYSKIQTEIEKCELVCCMCHRIRTWNRSHPNDLISNN